MIVNELVTNAFKYAFENLWSIPASRTKNKIEHVIPLSPRAREILLAWRETDLRRSGATYLEEQNVSPRVIRKLLNHKTGGEVSAVTNIHMRAVHEYAVREAVKIMAAQFDGLE